MDGLELSNFKDPLFHIIIFLTWKLVDILSQDFLQKRFVAAIFFFPPLLLLKSLFFCSRIFVPAGRILLLRHCKTYECLWSIDS